MTHKTTADIHAWLEHMSTWPEGWNGYNALPPKAEALAHTERWLNEIIPLLGERWLPVNITAGGQGDVACSWSYGVYTLEAILDGLTIDCMKVWGRDVNCLITDAGVETHEDFVLLWNWLLEENA